MILELLVLFYFCLPKELLHKRAKQRMLHPFKHLPDGELFQHFLLSFAEIVEERLNVEFHLLVN